MRVLIVADNALAAEAFRRVMRHAPACRVIGYVSGRGPCAAAVANAQPDLVVVDEMDAPETTLARIREVRAATPTVKIVLLTVRMEDAWLAEASAAGIDAAIARSAQSAAVGILVREVAAGNVFHAFTPVAAAARPQSDAVVDLTAREMEILRRVAAGASNHLIAGQLFVTEQTVKFHLSNIYRKLGVANRTQASHFAHLNGLIEPLPLPSAAGGLAPVPLAA